MLAAPPPRRRGSAVAEAQSANGKRVRPRTSGLQMFSGNVPVSIEAITRAPIR